MRGTLKKITALFLSITSVILMTACSEGDDNNKVSDTAAANNTISESDSNNSGDSESRISYDLPVKDFEGYNFTFLVSEFDGNGYWGSVEIYADEINAIPLNDAVYERNEAIQSKYKITISEIRDNNFNALVTAAVASGDNEYDCIMPKLTTVGSMGTSGQLLPFKMLEHIDLSQPWWDQSSNEQLSIGDEYYYLMGDLNLLDNEATYVMMFNKDVAADYNIENLYDMVRNNEWTYDKLHEVAEIVTSDLNGDGKYDENDRVGVLTDINAIRNGMFYASGCTFFTKNSDDLPQLSVNLERATLSLEKIIAISDDKNITMLASYLSHISDPWTHGLNMMFKEGRGLFYGIGLTVMSKMRDMESDFGLLPYPKLDSSQQNYISYVAAHCANTIAVPVTCDDYERTSLILEAMAYESKYTVTPTYYDVTITNKTMRDTESAEMLDIIFANRAYDLAEIYNWGGISELVTGLKDAGTLSSNFAKKEKSANLAINRTLDKYLEIKDKY